MAQVAIGRRRLARPTVVDLTAALFVIGMALSIPASRLGTVGGVQFLFDFVVIPLLVYFCARELLRGPKGMEQTALVLAIIGAMLGFFAVREQLTNLPFLNPISHRWTYGSGIWKITSFFGVPAIMSLTLVMTVPAILVAATRPLPPARRFLWSAALIVTLAGILQTYVRAGWLAAVVALILVLILTPATRRYSLRLTLVAVLLIAILSGGLIPRMAGISEGFISQTSSVSGEIIPQTSNVSGGFINSSALEDRLTSEGPIDYRMEALQVGLQIAARSPIFGLGLGNFGIGARDTDWAFSKSLGVVAGAWLVDPHNMYIYVLTSAGLVGLVTFLLLLGSVAFRGIRGWRRAGRLPGGDQGRWAVLLATLSAYAVFAYTFDAIHAQLATMLLFLVVGAVLAPPQDTASAETQA
jgi:O-antigen ligase